MYRVDPEARIAARRTARGRESGNVAPQSRRLPPMGYTPPMAIPYGNAAFVAFLHNRASQWRGDALATLHALWASARQQSNMHERRSLN